MKVAVLGAAGGIGQPLALLLKANARVTRLALFDIVNTPGVAADLGHINTGAPVAGYVGDAQLADALAGSDVVVIPAGVPRKPGMTRDDLFNVNAGIVKNLITGVAKHCPKAFVLIISNPVNSTVPIAAEVLKAHGVFDPKRVFGITTLDIVRASTFVAQLKGGDPSSTRVPVIGGHSGVTIIPLLSQVAGVSFSDDDVKKLTQRIQFGGDEVVQAKNGTGSATLSMAFAGARFVNSLLEAQEKKGVVECAYVLSDVAAADGLAYFASPVELGPDGASKVHGYGALSPYERELYAAAVPELKKNIEKGVEFVQKASL